MVEKWVNPKGHTGAKTKEIFKVSLINTDKEGILVKTKPGGKKNLKSSLRLSLEIVPLE
jgi:hypothetical protein